MNYSLTLVPFAGLCNRINAMLNAIAIAKSKSLGQSLSLQIYWQKTNDCAAYFDELFQPISGIDVQRLSKLSLKPANKKNLYIPSMLRKLGGVLFDTGKFHVIEQSHLRRCNECL